MLIHIGGQYVVLLSEITAILNIEKLSQINTEFLETASYKNQLIKTNDSEKFKTCIITKDKIYLSSISSYTLSKRNLNFK